MTVLLTFAAGAICGAVFAAVKLPVPAPPTIAGVMGIVGIVAGYAAVGRLL